MEINELKAIVEMFAIIFGGIWVMWRFSKQREMHPKAEFDLDCEVIGQQSGKKALQLTASIENKGIVRHKIIGESFVYTVRYLLEGDELNNGFVANEINYFEINFQRLLSWNDEAKFSWVPNYEYTFIDPGVCQKYRAVVAIPEDATFVLLHSRFDYQGRNSDEHSALRIFSVK